MLVEKEVIRPGTYWYREEATGLPRKLVVTPELTRYWHEQGNAMLSAGLTVPVPCEHDFDAHPMTPADKLKSNAGWVKGYSLKGDKLFSSIDVTDVSMAKKLPHTVRWTSPWINSFTDGNGHEWKNVISHLALTTRPRIINQQPFSSIAAALSVAVEAKIDAVDKGYCLSRAGLLAADGQPTYPMAFSLWGGIGLALNKPSDDKDGDDDGLSDDLDLDNQDADEDDNEIPDALEDSDGDVGMEELLCDLLGALGIDIQHTGNEEDFKRSLYNGAMTKIHELTGKAQNADKPPNRTNPPGHPPNNQKVGAPGQQNPLIQQEQQPMYMSLDDINKLPDPMKGVALAMYNENVKLRAEMEASKKVTDSLRDAKLKEASAARATRVSLLSKLSPRVKADLDAMLSLPAMALSMGEGGLVVDPMAQTLAVLEKGLADLPRLLTTDASALSVQPQPQDADMLTEEKSNEIADGLARQMGCPPVKKAS